MDQQNIFFSACFTLTDDLILGDILASSTSHDFSQVLE